MPRLRPAPFTKPHPYVIRAASSEDGALHLARRGLPFLMNVQSLEVTQKRLAAYRATLTEAALVGHPWHEATLQAAQASMKAAEQPRLDETLSALATAAAGR